LTPRDVDVDALEIVLTRAAHADGLRGIDHAWSFNSEGSRRFSADRIM
jgi:hypothetical protein